MSDAFTAKKGGPPAVASTGEGFAVFQVADVHAAHAPTFDEYKPHLVEDFRDQQLPQLLAAKTNALAAAAKKDGNLAVAAKSVGAAVKTEDFVGRDGQVPDLGQLGQIAPQVFDLGDNQVSNAINTGRNGIVIKVTGKQEPDAAEIAKNLPQAREQMANQQREELFAVYVTNITQQYEKSGRVLMNKKTQQQQPLIPG
jgi:peptidyl-prolyl cis-trans isomerase D